MFICSFWSLEVRKEEKFLYGFELITKTCCQAALKPSASKAAINSAPPLTKGGYRLEIMPIFIIFGFLIDLSLRKIICHPHILLKHCLAYSQLFPKYIFVKLFPCQLSHNFVWFYYYSTKL